MTNLLINLFIGKNADTKQAAVRTKYGTLSGITGCVCNLILFIAKLIIGTLSGSISITADAINNLSDMGSCLVSLFGFKFSSRPADDKHPFGHGRYEYLSTLVVAIIILAVGIELIKSSVEKIIHPSDVTVSVPLVIVLLLSMAVKLWMFFFNRKLGKKISSQVLTATASDSINDVISTFAVLVAALLGKFFGLHLDGYMGVAVAIFIMISGIGIVREALGPILGEAPDKEMVDKLSSRVLSYEGIYGIHDLVIHNYGPSKWMASLHAEVPADVDILVSHDLIDHIERVVLREMGIDLVIHMDPIVTNDARVNDMRIQVANLIHDINSELSMHDFRMVEGPSHTNLIFDVVLPHNAQMTKDELLSSIDRMVKEKLGKHFLTVVTVDQDYT
ncbi:MAG: cation transporter [Clostridia bacterium]|nr:cation transporter [Clostridia bacterium]